MRTRFRLLEHSAGLEAAQRFEQDAIKQLEVLPFVVQYDPIKGVDGLYEQILRSQVYCLGMPADVVFVDNLRLLTEDESQRAQELMLGLKDIARELDLTVVATFPLPDLNGRVPQLVDFKEWEPVASLSDRVFGLHRVETEDGAKHSCFSKTLVDIYPLRNGRGSYKAISLLFDGHRDAFSVDTSTVVRKHAVLHS
jgi:replicative DNA helicase